ncbi:MAG: heme-binding protein [Planctomycetes bacterium]|nr:heme-binding protein [Planctomycetota bacterium]
MARAAVARGWVGGTGRTFWTLFRHIEERSISMTAPVEMTYADRRDEERVETMAFLYAHTGIGETGRAGEVEILDVPAARVVSLGLRGAATEREFRSAQRELEAWLSAHPQWCTAGPMRVMAWNSPMLRAAERFHEVQLPIRPSVPATDAGRAESRGAAADAKR